MLCHGLLRIARDVVHRGPWKWSLFRMLLALASWGGLEASVRAAGSYAFLVAAQEYDPTQLTSLKYTERDVTVLAEQLPQLGYPKENIVLLTQSLGAKQQRYLPMRKNIDKELKLLLNELKGGDTLLVVFSGHGVQFRGDQLSYFCPMDADLGKRETLVSLDEVFRTLGDAKQCAATNKLLIVDACRNEPQSDVAKATTVVKLEPIPVKRPEPAQGLAALFSCKQDEKSFEHPDLKHGVFLHFVIDALKGNGDLNRDGELSLPELELHAVKNTQKFARLKFGIAQTPERRGQVQGLMTIGKLLTPPLLKAPFTAAQAKSAQDGWAKAKGLSVTLQHPAGGEMVLIPPGEFLMGSPAGVTDAETDEKPQHRVRITQPFYLGATEVTIGQFRRFVNATGYKSEAETDGQGGWGYDGKDFKQDKKFNWRNTGFEPSPTDDHPVVNVSWNDAQKFIDWCNSQSTGQRYRLPTEAEWEYACRAGTVTRYHSGDDPESLARVGNVADGTFSTKLNSTLGEPINSKDGYVFTAPAGRFAKNNFGLYDLYGNVWEWCNDWYDGKEYGKRGGVTENPSGPSSGSSRVLRGGGWSFIASSCRSAYRYRGSPDYRYDDLGFRVAVVPSPE